MTKSSLTILILSALLTGFAAFAKSSAPRGSATMVDAACRQQLNDPFDLGWRLTNNSHAYPQSCLNTKSLRPAKILSESSSELHFANFYHKGKYWTASWNKNSNRPRVQFYLVHFDSGVPIVTAGHTELHFAFPHDIELVSQTTGERTTAKDVVVSWEAVRPSGVDFSVFTGIQDSYGLAGRVVSLRTRIPENILPNGTLRQTDVYDLRMTSSQAAYLFLISIGESSDLGFSQFYETLGRNCTSQLFNLLDATLHVMDPSRLNGVTPFRTQPALDPIIGPSREALVARGLIAPNVVPQDLATLMKLKSAPKEN